VVTRKGVSLTWSQIGQGGLDELMYRRIPLDAWGRCTRQFRRALRPNRCW
jgi:hypothetical protein